MRNIGFSRKKFIIIVFVLLLILLVVAYYVVTTQFVVTSVEVEGNEHYTSEQIEEMVLPGGILNNSLYLSLRYHDKEMRDVPFVESMDVEVISNHAIRIVVYEKALAGCVSYLGNYVYFDREGVVVESASELTDGVPEIKGLHFDHIVLHEALPVADETVFSEILKVTQLMAKYEIVSDKIFFATDNEVILYFGDARVYLGDETNIEQKIMQLSYILPSLEGKSGVLHMENYSADTENLKFLPDES